MEINDTFVVYTSVVANWDFLTLGACEIEAFAVFNWLKKKALVSSRSVNDFCAIIQPLILITPNQPSLGPPL